MLTISIDDSNGYAVLRCAGRIVKGEESALLCALVQRHGQDIILDLSEVSAIDASGIGALVSAQAAGIYLKLMNPTEPVRAVLELTGMESVFEIGEKQTLATSLGVAEVAQSLA